MKRKNNTRQRGPRAGAKSKSWSFFSLYRPIYRPSPRVGFEGRVSRPSSLKLARRPLAVSKPRAVTRQSKNLTAQALQAMSGPQVRSTVNCDRSFKRLLSWRADQKGKGKGGRKRKPRSQREKAASAAKHFKDC